eukprot:215850-Rhodomonas_salina.2
MVIQVQYQTAGFDRSDLHIHSLHSSLNSRNRRIVLVALILCIASRVLSCFRLVSSSHKRSARISQVAVSRGLQAHAPHHHEQLGERHPQECWSSVSPRDLTCSSHAALTGGVKQQVQLSLWDLGGQDHHRALWKHWHKGERAVPGRSVLCGRSEGLSTGERRWVWLLELTFRVDASGSEGVVFAMDSSDRTPQVCSHRRSHLLRSLYGGGAALHGSGAAVYGIDAAIHGWDTAIYGGKAAVYGGGADEDGGAAQRISDARRELFSLLEVASPSSS